MIEVVGSVKAAAPDRLAESKTVLRALFAKISQSYSRLWIFWNGTMPELMNRTKGYSGLEEEDEISVNMLWTALVTRSRATWQAQSQADIVEAAALDEHEIVEQALGDLEVNNDDDLDQEVEKDPIGAVDDDAAVDELDEDRDQWMELGEDADNGDGYELEVD